MKPRSLRLVLALGALALGLASSGFAVAATGTAGLAWNACGPTSTIDLAVAPGQATGINLTASVTGQSDPTLAYQVRVLYGNPRRTVPDAWRFDVAGCQTNLYVTINHLPPAALAKTCPAFQNAGGTPVSLQIKDLNFVPPSLGYATSLMLIQIANAYPSGNLPTAAQKYFLMDAEFDQTFGANGVASPPNCGGLEQPICFTLISASYIVNDGSGTEVSFQLGGQGMLITANALGGSCLVDPAHAATWGRLKAQYRQ